MRLLRRPPAARQRPGRRDPVPPVAQIERGLLAVRVAKARGRRRRARRAARARRPARASSACSSATTFATSSPLAVAARRGAHHRVERVRRLPRAAASPYARAASRGSAGPRAAHAGRRRARGEKSGGEAPETLAPPLHAPTSALAISTSRSYSSRQSVPFARTAHSSSSRSPSPRRNSVTRPRRAVHGGARALDLLLVLAVERVGDPQDGREAAHLAARLLVELAVAGVARVGRALAVVARDVRDDRALVRRDAHDVGVLDQVLAMLVVAAVVDVVADVVEHGRDRAGAERSRSPKACTSCKSSKSCDAKRHTWRACASSKW